MDKPTRNCSTGNCRGCQFLDLKRGCHLKPFILKADYEWCVKQGKWIDTNDKPCEGRITKYC